MENELEILTAKTQQVIDAINNGATAAEVTALTLTVFKGYINREFYIGRIHVAYFLNETVEAIVCRIKTTRKMAEYLSRFNDVLTYARNSNAANA